MAQRGDSDKLNPTHVSSSRAPAHLGQTGRHHHHHSHHHHHHDPDDDDKLLDVVGPPQSPMLPLSHSLQQMHAHPHSGIVGKDFLKISIFIRIFKYIFNSCMKNTIIKPKLYTII